MKSIELIKADKQLAEVGIHCDKWRLPYDEILKDLSFLEVHKPDVYLETLKEISTMDFFFFCYVILNLPVNHPYLLARCYEVQDNFGSNCLWLWARDHWKALACDTPVMTKKGWKKHGELQVGDYVVGSSGDFVKIIARTKNFHNSRQYEITFDRKYKIICSSDHLWEVNSKSRKRVTGTKNRRIGREKMLVTADQIFEHGCECDNRYSVDVLHVNYEKKKLKIDPYVLGAWLGDGISSDGRIHGLDVEIFDKIKSLGYDIRDTSRDVTKSIHKFAVILKEIGLKNNKHIPEEYKYSSIEQRMELIRGLMDTDGCIDDRCTCTFTNINKKLCDDLYEILVSVGYKPNYRTHVGKFCDDNYVFYNISFNARKENNPFFINRKASKVYLENKPKMRFITDIKPLTDGEYVTNCIQVDSEDGIYLAGKEMIPTHNSTLLTYAGNIWHKINHPGLSTAILSNSSKVAKPHFNLIKRTCESNTMLKRVWSDIFYQSPKKDPNAQWSDDGLYLKTTKLKEPAFGYYGVLDTMPTGMHFDVRIFDDLVDINNVGSHAMMLKVLEVYKNADNLKRGEDAFEHVIGTRYKFKDLYEFIMGLKMHRVSLIASEVDEIGNPKYEGKPIYLSAKALAEKRKKQGAVYWAHNLQTPLEAGSAQFKKSWLKFYDNPPDDLYYYIVSDPASNPQYSISKNSDLDYSVQLLIGAGKGRKIYILDIVRDRISLKEKWESLKYFHSRHKIMETGYEEFGNQKDREYFDEKMREESFYFNITPIKYRHNNAEDKNSRINVLTEYFSEGKILLPKSLVRLTKERGLIDLVEEFIEDEYSKYPAVSRDDILDCLSRISDLNLIYPEGEEEIEEVSYSNFRMSPLDEQTDWQCVWGDM